MPMIASFKAARLASDPIQSNSGSEEIVFGSENQDSVILTNSSLPELRNQVHSALLAEFQKLSKDRQVIPWRRINVHGWPDNVLFYVRHSWREKDCLLLMEALNRGEISFSFKQRQLSKLPPPTMKQKEALQEKFLLLSRKLCGSLIIRWQTLIALHPGLHLSQPYFKRFFREDYCAAVEYLKALKEKLHLDWLDLEDLILYEPVSFSESQKEESEDDEDDEDDEDLCEFLRETLGESESEASPVQDLIPKKVKKSSHSPSGLRNKAYSLLLKEFKKVCPNSKRVNWALATVTGWPEEVIFYFRRYLSRKDCSSIISAIERGEIKFVLNAKSKPVPRPQESVRLSLNQRLLHASKELFGTSIISWSRIKQICPWLHLFSIRVDRATAADCEMLERVLKVLEGMLQNSNSKNERMEVEQDTLEGSALKKRTFDDSNIDNEENGG